MAVDPDAGAGKLVSRGGSRLLQALGALGGVTVVVAFLLAACGAPESRAPLAQEGHEPNPGVDGPAGDATVPEPDTTRMEPLVEQRFRETRAAVLANPGSADAWAG